MHTNLTISYYKVIDILCDDADGGLYSFLLFSETIITIKYLVFCAQCTFIIVNCDMKINRWICWGLCESTDNGGWRNRDTHTDRGRGRGRERLCACYNVSEKDADINTYTDGQINQFQAPLDSYGFSARHTFLSLSHCFSLLSSFIFIKRQRQR